LGFFGTRNVAFFVDNYKVQTMLCGKIVKSFDYLKEVAQQYDVVVSVGKELCNEIAKQLSEFNISYKLYSDLKLEWMQSVPDDYLSDPKIAKFRDAYKGQSCFLIGNGPSLRVADLEKLKSKGVLTFACNYINKLFDKTDWRPDFYCVGEPSIIVLNMEFIKSFKAKAKFVYDVPSDKEYAKFFEGTEFSDDICFYKVSGNDFTVSSNAAKCLFSGYTVMFHMIQFAFYMGFGEIYLLGVENTQLPTVHNSNFIDADTHFYNEDAAELEKRREILESWEDVTDEDLYLERLDKEYIAAKEYADTHGIKIYNATRGGRLEVFERVDFDNLFGENANG
jgi:hypothetical protein